MKKKVNTLFFKVIVAVIIGLCCLTVALSLINVQQTEKVYIDNYVDSQEKIFSQIDVDIYNFFQDVTAIHSTISGSSTIYEYITRETWSDVVDERGNLLDMARVLDNTPLVDYPEFNLIILGVNGKIYTKSSSSTFTQSAKEILESDRVVERIMETPTQLICMYRENGYVNWQDNTPVIVMGKAIRNQYNGKIVGVAMISMKQEEFARKYSYFTTGSSDIVFFNQDNEIISSNNQKILLDDSRANETLDILSTMEEENLKAYQDESGQHVRQYMLQNLQNTNYKMLGIIDPQQAFDNDYNLSYVVGVAIIITLGLSLILFIIIRQQTKPLSGLVRQMQYVREGRLDRFADVKGATEIRELAETYNKMIKDLESYIEQIMEAEKGKREAEIHSLQMQINPHYIYNTLASIKWLIWQGEREKSVNTIDAFIRLLRNTISNKQDRITVGQEIDNLKDYVYINQIRYGSQVNVEYYIMPQCEELQVPKLILQPFVENAFFHAFPEGRPGTISVFAKRTERYLEIEIIDDGVGIEYNRLMEILSPNNQLQEHFTGIGINNVDDRLKLIYGDEYGINIQSEQGKGTTIVVCLPVTDEQE